MVDEKVVKKAKAIHAEIYGKNPTTVAYAPGRIEVLGNHTDYNDGTTIGTEKVILKQYAHSR